MASFEAVCNCSYFLTKQTINYVVNNDVYEESKNIYILYNYAVKGAFIDMVVPLFTLKNYINYFPRLCLFY